MKHIALLFFTLAFSFSANAGVIFYDDFTGDTSGNIADWTGEIATTGLYSPDVVQDTTFCGGILNNTCLDMDGSGANSNADLTTALPLNLVAGDYTFSFNWGNNRGNTAYTAYDNILNWSIFSGSTTLALGFVNSGTAQDFSYELDSTAFTLASAFSNVYIRMWQSGTEGSQDGGTILDDVKLTLDQAASVPEPSILFLLALGLLGLGSRRQYRYV